MREAEISEGGREGKSTTIITMITIITIIIMFIIVVVVMISSSSSSTHAQESLGLGGPRGAGKRARACLARALARSEGGMIQLETLIELKSLNSSCLSFLSCRN